MRAGGWVVHTHTPTTPPPLVVVVVFLSIFAALCCPHPMHPHPGEPRQRTLVTRLTSTNRDGEKATPVQALVRTAARQPPHPALGCLQKPYTKLASCTGCSCHTTSQRGGTTSSMPSSRYLLDARTHRTECGMTPVDSGSTMRSLRSTPSSVGGSTPGRRARRGSLDECAGLKHRNCCSPSGSEPSCSGCGGPASERAAPVRTQCGRGRRGWRGCNRAAGRERAAVSEVHAAALRRHRGRAGRGGRMYWRASRMGGEIKTVAATDVLSSD